MQQFVHIIDDEDYIRDAIGVLVKSVGLNPKCYAGAEDFLADLTAESSGCVLTDMRMRGMSGVELQEVLIRRGVPLPVIIISAFASTPVVVRVMKNGAITVLEKPFDDQELLDAVHASLERNRQMRVSTTRTRQIQARIETLTAGEREVLDMIVAGAANKVIAANLGVSLRTVEGRRHKVLRKLEADSVAELVQLVMEAGATKESA